jgi:hypothetical protein
VGICGQAVDCFGIEDVGLLVPLSIVTLLVRTTVASTVIGSFVVVMLPPVVNWVLAVMETAPSELMLAKLSKMATPFGEVPVGNICHGAGICRRDSGCHVQDLSPLC